MSECGIIGLAINPTSAGTIPASGNAQYSFGVNIPKGTTAASLSQTVTFLSSC